MKKQFGLTIIVLAMFAVVFGVAGGAVAGGGTV